MEAKKYSKTAHAKRRRRRRRLLKIHRSLKSILGRFIFFVAVTIAVLYLDAFWSTLRIEIGSINLPAIPLRWLLIIPSICFLELIRKYLNDLYIFESDCVIHSAGRLAFQYNKPTLRYIDIRAIIVQQSLLGRILDYGNIGLGTSARDRIDMRLAGVGSPRQVAKMIEQLRNYHQTHLRKNCDD